MKYFWFFLFNLLGVYVLVLFFVGKGGVVENMKKLREITELRKEQLQLQLEIEELKNKILVLKSLRNDENQVLLEQGKKKGNTLIFKFVNKNDENKMPEKENQPVYDNLTFKLYFSVALVIIMIIVGNTLIYFKCLQKGN